ncbi:Gfo/Idh/MocA family protein [Abyssalbus ytuae]|uniref:Gfo/Idh/MocA family oxidoreductase n=1 Tax=Abyssalbus ytuae TaxID=2926907 RepID=A0A9E7CZ44_9FLAO|nr:Gfo/Idh/MocA family oxidoreductase [Abyssalbus ytuae]UOB17245.1 Gfo/Idh/MocA family oxidoreductase [Abyssalbus ytuae]
MQSQTKIRWGIIGLGNIAHKFATDLLTVEDAQLYAVASRSRKTADEFSKKYNAIKAYGSYRELAEDKNVDAVYIATPHVFHKENTLMCLQQGIPVLCEKPFAMNINEVEEMIALAMEKKVLLMEAMWTYFLPHYQHVLNILQKKEYGNILKIEADFGITPEYNPLSRTFNKALGGGSLLDIGIYPIFAALSTLGIPNKIEASAKYFETGADASCHIQFYYDKNVKATLNSSFVDNTPTTATFYCEKATIKINRMFFLPTTVTIVTDKDEKTLDFGYKTLGYNYEAIHFNELIRQGKKQSPIMSFDFSRKLITLLDKVRSEIGLEYNLE